MEVLTYNGSFEKKKDCIEINGIWYKKDLINNKDAEGAVKINNIYTPVANLKFDYLKQKWSDNPNLSFGFVDDFEKGYFEKDLSKVCEVEVDGEVFPFYNYNKLPLNYKFCQRLFRFTKNPLKAQEGKKPNYNLFSNGIYDAGDNNYFKEFCDSYEDLPEQNETRWTSLFSKYRFGLELETSGGGIPEFECFNKLLLPLKDGSITGHEYVTIPMKGAKGVRLLESQLDLLSESCTLNAFCSMHIHFSGVPMTEKYIKTLYFLCYRLQHEIAELFAPFKRKVEYFKAKKEVKDHCEPLPRLGNHLSIDYFNTILKHLNDGLIPEHYEPGQFPIVHNQNGNNKWNWTRRYYWVNFLPLIFKPQSTVEFRFHSGTLNKYKVFFWMLICQAILRFAEEEPKKVMDYKNKLNLEEVLSLYKETPFIYNTLISYVDDRKNKHYDLSVGKDIYGDEFAKDAKFEFKYAGKTVYEWEKEQK